MGFSVDFLWTLYTAGAATMRAGKLVQFAASVAKDAIMILLRGFSVRLLQRHVL